MSTREPLLPAYLICGSDRPKVELAVRRLRARVEEEGGAVEAYAAAGETPVVPDEVASACNALGLFGGLRLILVTGVEAWEKASLDQLLAYVAGPAPDTVLALVGEKVKPDSPLGQAVAKGGRVLAYELPERKELPGWLRKQAERAGLDLEPEALRRLLELGRDDALALSGELEKLALWADGRAVTAADVDLLCVLDPDIPPWDLTDAVGERRGEAALATLGRFLDRRDHDVARILPSLARHVRQLSTAKLLVDQGAGADEVAKALGLRSPFPARKLVRQCGGWTREQLSEAMARIALAERQTRGDSPLPDRFSLELALDAAVS